MIPSEPTAPISNNKPGFKYKYPEAAPTPPGEDDAEWNKVYTAADSRFYNRNGKSADKSRKFRQSGETYQLAIVMMAEKKEKMKTSGVNPKVAPAKPKAPKKTSAVVKTEASNSSRDGTPWVDRVPMSISEQIKSEGRARKAPSAAPSSKQSTPVPVSLTGVKTGSPPPKVDKPPPKKKGTAAPVKKPSKPRGPGTHSFCSVFFTGYH
jgi:COMPASS component SPP1